MTENACGGLRQSAPRALWFARPPYQVNCRFPIPQEKILGEIGQSAQLFRVRGIKTIVSSVTIVPPVRGSRCNHWSVNSNTKTGFGE